MTYLRLSRSSEPELVARASPGGLRQVAEVIHSDPTQSEAIKRVADARNLTRLTPVVKTITASLPVSRRHHTFSLLQRTRAVLTAGRARSR